MTTIYYFPDEVIEEILLRLPPRSLRRFRCVCKSWNTLINDQSFVNKHLHIRKSRSLCSASLFLSWMRNVNDDHVNSPILKQERCSVVISSANDVKDNSNHIPYGIEYLDLSVVAAMVDLTFLRGCHCNGIISLSGFLLDFENLVVLFNPSIREFKILPRCIVNGFSVMAEGFGYDCKANDYKFVRIFNSRKSFKCIAMVYNMGSDSWRQIKMDVEGFVHVSNRARVYCKGVYYWWAPFWLKTHAVILSFDMSSEEFDIIPLPDNLRKEGKDLNLLAVRNESLLLFFPKRTRVHSFFEIWAMNECSGGGVKGPCCWTKLLTIGPFVGIAEAIAFWKSDELVMRTVDGQLVSYSLGGQKLKNLPLHGVLPGGCFGDFYVERMVSVNRRN